ncbi:hypothetical protein [Rubrimonas cliftonensis]|uniref:Uncharacterized protein n=1 Tax=Rubrimonas cliftonensis TaxID=89524 RepID=A0A1H4FYL4_9RHOB|nr:hypothetical protein [Rubrimonas cliftonensis]SEB02197.1 hypothetical protein SAMN05444370_13113 [Rubrimonas cliftonensis]
MLDLNTVIRPLDNETAEETRNDTVEALATACAAKTAPDSAYCSGGRGLLKRAQQSRRAGSV